MSVFKNDIKKISAFAPASSSNLSVGYDLLGFPFAKLGDEVSLNFNDSNEITITEIESEKALPKDPLKNTATYALTLMCQFLEVSPGIEVHIKKGIPLCSGLGGSAASAVAAVYALNACLLKPLDKKQLAFFAIEAEALASGEKHPDNVVPSLWGQLSLIQSIEPLEIITLPLPELFCVLVHPHIEISTQLAREALSPDLTLSTHIRQSANLAGLISSFYQKDWQLLSRSTEDVLIEPQRAHLLPGFEDIKASAIKNGALCCSFSGAGPTLYAFCETEQVAANVATEMQKKCLFYNMQSDAWAEKMANIGPYVTY